MPSRLLTLCILTHSFFPFWETGLCVHKMITQVSAVASTTTTPVTMTTTTTSNPSCNQTLNQCSLPDTMNCQAARQSEINSNFNPSSITGECSCSITHSPFCSCTNGFQSIPGVANRCQDIDECSQSVDHCNRAISICRNIRGSYVCDCQGFYRHPSSSDLQSCIDVNECTEQTPNPCQNIIEEERRSHFTPLSIQDNGCVNLEGDYRCLCNTGFSWEASSHTCTQIRYCDQLTACNLDISSCALLRGDYQCNCFPGYENAFDDTKPGNPTNKKCIAACRYNDWGEYSACNVTCGMGMYNRTRTVREGGPECGQPRFTMSFLQCMAPPCTTTCSYSAWSVWSNCNVTTGYGYQTRTRLILTGAANCDPANPLNQTQPCYVEDVSPSLLSRTNWTQIGIAGGVAGALAAGLCTGIVLWKKSTQQPEFIQDIDWIQGGQWK